MSKLLINQLMLEKEKSKIKKIVKKILSTEDKQEEAPT